MLNQKFNNLSEEPEVQKKEKRGEGRGEERERGVGQGSGKKNKSSQPEQFVLDKKYCEITMASFHCK